MLEQLEQRRMLTTELVLDTEDMTGIQIAGQWSPSSGVDGFHGQNYLHDHNSLQGQKSVTFTPDLPSDGRYEVFLRWTANANRASNAKVAVQHQNGTATTTVNQRIHNGVWITVGEFDFLAGRNGGVTVANDNADGYVIADAVRFELKTPAAIGPEIELRQNNTVIADGGTLNFGTTTVGNAVTRDVTVGNVGTEPLTLTPLNAGNVPVGFTLIANLGATNLAPGQSTTFSIRLDATSTGSFGGTITLASNDTDENPYNLLLQGNVVDTPLQTEVILDTEDGQGVSVVGDWAASSGVSGFHGANYLFDQNSGKGQKSVTFAPTLVAGQYEVFLRWTSHSNRASNVPVTVQHADGPLPVTVDQRTAGGQWNSLGAFNFSDGTDGRVVISNAGTNGHVIADAVRFVPLGQPVSQPEIEVLRNGIVIDDGGNIDFGTTTVGNPVDVTLTVQNTGTANLTLTPLNAGNFPNGFSLVSNFGAATLSLGQSTTFTVRMLAQATGGFSGPTDFNNTDADENPFNLFLQGNVTGSSGGGAITLDTEDGADVTVVGQWAASSGVPGFHGANYLHDLNAGKGQKSVTFRPNVPVNGIYRVSLRWASHANRASNAPVKVFHAGGRFDTQVNQQTNGGQWNAIGEFGFQAGQEGTIVISNEGTNGYVIADAVLLEPVSPSVDPPPPPPPPSSSEVVLDNDEGSPAVEIVGNWAASSGVGGFVGDDYLYDMNTGQGQKRVTYRPGLASQGHYEVFVRWTSHANRASNAKLSVNHVGGAFMTTVNQQTNGGQWISLGEFDLDGSASVTISNEGANGNVVADAVRFLLKTPPTPAPEIDVQVSGSSISDGGTVDFGTTPPGTPVDRTITIRNTGTASLTLTPINSGNLPAGFSLISNLGTTNLAAGASTTFTLRLTAASLGNFSGSLAISNNDADEDPYDLNLTGTVSAGPVAAEVIVDSEESTGVTIVGQWSASSGVAGFHGSNYLYDQNSGKGQKSVTFHPSFSNSGIYEVSARWTSASNRASNVPIDITHQLGTTNTTVNQRQQGGQWVPLGEFQFQAGNSGTVTIRNSGTNGHVIADAVRFRPTGTVSQEPDIAVSAQGTPISDGGQLDFGTTTLGSSQNITVTVSNQGNQTLNLSPIGAVPSGYALVQNVASTSIAPGGSTSFVLQLVANTEGTFGGSISITNNDPDENPFSLNVTGEVVATPAVLIVDNSDSGFSEAGGGWNTGGLSGPFQGDYRFHAAGNGSATATWSFQLQPGIYQVSATWTPHANRATNAPYTISGGSQPASAVVNQEHAPDDFTDAGVPWEDIGQVTVFGSTLTVELSNNADDNVIADAIRVERLTEIIQSNSQLVTASAGGTVSLPQGGSISIPAGALPSDQIVTLFQTSSLPNQPANDVLESVGPVLSVAFATPPSSGFAAEGEGPASNGGNIELTIDYGNQSISRLDGGMPFVNLVNNTLGDLFAGASGIVDQTNNVARIQLEPAFVQELIDQQLLSIRAGITNLALDAITTTTSPQPVYLQNNPVGTSVFRDLSDVPAGQLPPGFTASGKTLVVLHGIFSNVNDSFGPCIDHIRDAGGYDQVVGFNYDFTKGIEENGTALANFLNDLRNRTDANGQKITELDIEAHSYGTLVSSVAASKSIIDTLRIRNMVFLGGPLTGTPAADTAVSLLTYTMNTSIRTGNLPEVLAGATISDLLSRGMATDIRTGVPQEVFDAINTNRPETTIYAMAGTNPGSLGYLQSIGAYLDALDPSLSENDNDGLVPRYSAELRDRVVNNLIRLDPQPVGHTELECDQAALLEVASEVAASQPQIIVTPTANPTTTESGGSTTFTVVLNRRPSDDVHLNLQSLDPSEGIANPLSLTFTPSNWFDPAIVTVVGQDDQDVDGDQLYTIALHRVTSNDWRFDGLDPDDVQIRNLDNDRPPAGVTVEELDTVTSESGDTGSFRVRLNSQPTANVTILLVSDDTSEGTIVGPNLTFTPANWDQFQTVTIRGVDDNVFDGDVPYTILLSGTISDDPDYSGLDVPDVAFINLDNDPAPPPASPTGVWFGPAQQDHGNGNVYAGTMTLSLSPLTGLPGNFTGQLALSLTEVVSCGFGTCNVPLVGNTDVVATLHDNGTRLTFNLVGLLGTGEGTISGNLYSGSFFQITGGARIDTYFDNPGLTKVQSLQSSMLPTDGRVSNSLPVPTPSSVNPLLDQVLADWSADFQPPGLQIDFVDLPHPYLAFSAQDHIWLDRDANGWGWFVDSTPSTHEEYFLSNHRLTAHSPLATGRMDLLTVLAHEVGHLLGRDHVEDSTEDVMSATLPPGVRRLSATHLADDVFNQLGE